MDYTFGEEIIWVKQNIKNQQTNLNNASNNTSIIWI